MSRPAQALCVFRRGSSTTGRTNPMVTDLGQARGRHQLQQIIAGLSEGVILIEPGQRIVWSNEAALAMHGVESLEDLGATVDAYRRRFRLRYRNNHILKKSDYPLARVIAGETFSGRRGERNSVSRAHYAGKSSRRGNV